MRRCARSRSRSATSACVVLPSISAMGVERPAPRWSKSTMRQNDGIEIAAMVRQAAAAGAAVQEHDRHAVGAAARFPVERVRRIDGEPPGHVRIDLGKQDRIAGCGIVGHGVRRRFRPARAKRIAVVDVDPVAVREPVRLVRERDDRHELVEHRWRHPLARAPAVCDMMQYSQLLVTLTAT